MSKFEKEDRIFERAFQLQGQASESYQKAIDLTRKARTNPNVVSLVVNRIKTRPLVKDAITKGELASDLVRIWNDARDKVRQEKK